ncbi:MAG: hypothetical protein ABJP45_04505 [Cyclobacteriaceae bacterium]
MRILVRVSLVLLLSGCVPEGVMRTWSSSEEYNHRFENLMVIGLVNNVNLRNDVENEVVTAARKAKLQATNGMSMFPPELGKPFEDIERVKSRLREKGFDGILTATLIDFKAPRYVKPEATYQPLVYYDRFSNYYYRTYDLVYKPGYFADHTKYFIETNFYELDGGKLVWSGRSQVIESYQLEGFLPTYSKGLFRELSQQGVIMK